MQEDTLQKLVAEVCGEASKDEYVVGERDQLTILFNPRGPLEAVEQVVRIRIGEGYVMLHTRGKETYWIPLDQVVAMKALRGGRGGAGF